MKCSSNATECFVLTIKVSIRLKAIVNYMIEHLFNGVCYFTVFRIFIMQFKVTRKWKIRILIFHSLRSSENIVFSKRS